MMARILVLDLNPKLTYPDLSIAYLVTPLRAAGFQVEVQALATNKAENQMLKHKPSQTELNLTTIENYLKNNKPDLILIPSYLNHYASVQYLAKCTYDLQLPLLLGGACLYTCSSEDLPLWLNLQGVTAVFVGEADWVITDVVDTILTKQDLSAWPGIYQKGMELESMSAPALQELDLLPIPDFSDFAWKRTSSALIPVLTGRTATLENNQTVYSTRPVQAVLEELRIQAQTYQCKTFIFLDTSLNTNLAMWHGLIDNIQAAVPGCQWIATIYLNGKNALGLDLNTLVAARTAGLRHLNISLDLTVKSLKQGKILNAAIERNRELVAHAYQAGLSVRCLARNNNSFNNLADLPNTNDFVLRKLVETEQAKQVLSQSGSKSQMFTVSDKKISKAKLKQAQFTTNKKQLLPTELPTPSLWQRFKANLSIHKANKPNEANQLG